jgi:hypothetical protein
LEQIINDTIAVQRLQQEESERGFFARGFYAAFGESSVDLRMNIIKNQEYMNDLDKTFEGVYKDINALDLKMGADFKSNAEMAQNSMKQVNLLTKQLEKETDRATKKVLEAKIKGLNQSIAINQKSMKEMGEKTIKLFNQGFKSSSTEITANQKVVGKLLVEYEKITKSTFTLNKATKDLTKKIISTVLDNAGIEYKLTEKEAI